MTASDNGQLEVWQCQGPGSVLSQPAEALQSHDDMALGVSLLAAGEKVVSVGADEK